LTQSARVTAPPNSRKKSGRHRPGLRFHAKNRGMVLLGHAPDHTRMSSLTHPID
jgi:hypothetical protein